MIAHIGWMDDGVCEVNCTCGETFTVGETTKVCSTCGRRYNLIQWVSVESPIGRCEWCNVYIYGTQKTKKKYCSEKCGVLARLNKKLSA